MAKKTVARKSQTETIWLGFIEIKRKDTKRGNGKYSFRIDSLAPDPTDDDAIRDAITNTLRTAVAERENELWS